RRAGAYRGRAEFLSRLPGKRVDHRMTDRADWPETGEAGHDTSWPASKNLQDRRYSLQERCVQAVLLGADIQVDVNP
ncbi:hypothetical protein, partial [Roseovarius sp. D22-M7]|uniref:hypothetical protein n=1 Tax=Roseovarius sp. D22-M7 TaxID=3127116 RepID=UPI003010412D